MKILAALVVGSIVVSIAAVAAQSTAQNTAQSTAQSTTPVPACAGGICFLTAAAKAAYEKANNCTFTKPCHLADATDIIRWAIGKQETGVYGYNAPDANPCNAANHYCAATTGNPASAGQTEFYAASYGPQQITLKLLTSWLLANNGKSSFNPVPACLQTVLDDAAVMAALKDANKRQAYISGLVSGQAVPAATVNANGSITYPAVPAAIQAKVVSLGILNPADPGSVTRWNQLWQRMSAWQAERQIIQAAWAAQPNGNTAAGKLAAWGKAPNTRTNTPGSGLLASSPTSAFVKLLGALGMTLDGTTYTGIKPYVLKTLWAEASNDFGNAAFFIGAPPALYTDLMAFFGSGQCQIQAVNQMLRLSAHGYDGTHTDPKDSATKTWVEAVAGAWNGSGGNGSYAASVWQYYQDYYAKYFGKEEVCP